ncbi:MAG: BatD family protein [Arcicella sp.]|nr:BatD family protein [Arcicella sp.]
MSLIIGEKNISLDDPFIVTVVVKFLGESPSPECKFPDLPNFSKRGFSKSTARSFVSGQPVVTCTITQNYAPKKEGSLKVPAFKVNVNGEDLKSEAFTVKVTKPSADKKETNNPEAAGAKTPDNQDNKEDFTDFIEGNNAELANINTKEDAFLALNASKTNPYVGEGFTVTLAFYVADNNTADIQFDHNEIQIPEITKKIKPENCWEETFGITETQQSQVTINGKKYVQYKFYQATFYPLNTKAIVFPSVSLRLLKNTLEKNGAKKAGFTSFASRAFTIKAKELPPHPLKNEVSVGQFTWRENLNKNKINTGKSVEYRLQITGDGYNIKLPQVKNDSIFDFFPPVAEELSDPQSGKIIMTKSFTFQIIPKRAGNFALDKYFQWIYFNVKTARYDTLKSTLTLTVSGQTIQTADTPTEQLSAYDGLALTDSSEEVSNFKKILKDEANILIVIMLIGMIYILIPNRK